jgi:carboxymethylenebutenolidase
MDTFITRPDGSGPWPVVLLYMDGLGVRPALQAMAKQLAGRGYYVALPNLYYRSARAAALQLESDFERMLELYASLDADQVADATTALLAHSERDPAAKPGAVGCVGYCMGGGYALAMAGRFGEHIAAAACIHGGAVATDAPGSPHRLAAQMRAKIYVAVAEQDPYLQPGETERLQAALAAAQTDFYVEVYPGVAHGFAVPGLAVYNQAAAELHWQRLTALFGNTLQQRRVV